MNFPHPQIIEEYHHTPLKIRRQNRHNDDGLSPRAKKGALGLMCSEFVAAVDHCVSGHKQLEIDSEFLKKHSYSYVNGVHLFGRTYYNADWGEDGLPKDSSRSMFINAVRLGEEVFIRACHQTDVDPIWEAYNPFTGIWETLYVQERDGLPLQRISRADFGERFATVLTREGAVSEKRLRGLGHVQNIVTTIKNLPYIIASVIAGSVLACCIGGTVADILDKKNDDPAKTGTYPANVTHGP